MPPIADFGFERHTRCYAAGMRKLLSFILLSIAFSALLIPALLWTYQGFQFDGWLWDLSRMAADRIVATSAKGLLFGVAIAAAVVFRPQLFLGRHARKAM